MVLQMVLLRLACLTWYLQYCVQHQPWRSTWYLQGTQLLRESNLPTAYCHNQCPKAQVSTLPRIFMMMKYWTSVPVYCNYCCVGHFIDSSWTKMLTLLVLNFEIQIKARPFELRIGPVASRSQTRQLFKSKLKVMSLTFRTLFFTFQDLSWEPSMFALQIFSSFSLLEEPVEGNLTFLGTSIV